MLSPPLARDQIRGMLRRYPSRRNFHARQPPDATVPPATIPADSRAPAAARAPNVVSVSCASAYTTDTMPARVRSFPAGILNAASTSFEGIVLEPKTTCEETRNAGFDGSGM